MRALRWNSSHAVFVTEIDDEHREILERIARLKGALDSGAVAQFGELTGQLAASISEHFSHEERLMRASRYASARWHKEKHDSARRRVRQFVALVDKGEIKAATGLIEYLQGWLPDHMRLPDRMLAAHLRNHRRCMFTMSFRAGTRPVDACGWVSVKGEPLDLNLKIEHL